MNARKLRHTILVADLVWQAVALVVAYALRYGLTGQMFWSPFSKFGLEFVVSLVLWVALHEWMGLDSFRGGWNLPAVFSRVFLGVLTLMAMLLAGAYLARALVSRLVLTYFGVLLFVGFTWIRWLVQRLFKSRIVDAARRRVVIVGSGRTARELGAKIARHPETLCRVIGYLSAADTYAGGPQAADNSAVSLRTLGIVELVKTHRVDELILVGDSCSHPEMLHVAARCRNEGIHVSLVPELYELYLSKPNLMDLDGLPVLQLPQPSPVLASGLKRVVDTALTVLLLAPAIPLVLLAAALLKLQGKKAFRWEQRCGQQGKVFRMLRLNVNRLNVVNKAPDLTFQERVLEQLSITELPQLWNVLRGEMSLVGPRPEDPERVSRYTDWERQRLIVRPGITGLAQVQGLRDRHSSEEKCRFDLQYLLDCSPILDLSLLLQTVWTLAARLLFPGWLIADSVATLTSASSPISQEIIRAHRTQSSAD